MAEKPAHPVAIALFDLITETAADIRANPATVDYRIDSDSKILEFCEDFFQQFLKAVAGITIAGFDSHDKEEVARARLGSKSAPARRVMAQYEKLCDTYFELLGSIRLPGAERRFRTTYMTRLLARIEDWVKSINDPELAAKIIAAAADYDGAVSLE